MLIPVGNMNDKGENQCKSRCCKTRLTGIFFSLHWEKEIKGWGSGKSTGDSFVKGISIQSAKYQENNLKKIHCLEIMSIIASRQVQGFSLRAVVCC